MAINNSQISAEISARIEKIAVRSGDIVEADTVLATLDCRSYQNSLNAAVAQRAALRAQRKLAEQQLKRAKSLRKKNNLSVEALDQRVAELGIAEANLKAQQAQINEASLAQKRCTIVAPYRAAVTERIVGEGTMAALGQPIVAIVGLDEIEVVAQVPVDLSASLARSKVLNFVTHDAVVPVQIRVISAVIDAAVGSREVRLSSTQTLLPGSSGRLEWSSPPLLPANLLSRREEALGVFLLEDRDGRQFSRFVALPGALEGRPALINLPPGERVIMEGRQKLALGDEVLVVDSAGQ